MAILKERTVWRAQPERRRARMQDLTRAEEENVKKALRTLRRRYGNYRKLAKALDVNLWTLRDCAAQKPPSAGMALRAARLAGVHVEDLLSGAWPATGACPMCGREN